MSVGAAISGNSSADAIKAGEAFFEVNADDKNLTSTLKRIANRVALLGSQIKNLGVGTVAIGSAVVAPLTGFLTAAISEGKEFNDLALEFGDTAESLSTVAFAAKKTNTEFKDVLDSIKDIKKAAIDAANGSEIAIEAFARMGTTGAEFIKLPLDEQLLNIVAALDQIEDPVHRAEVALKLVGGNAEKMNRLLRQTPAELYALYEGALDAGAVISSETAKRAAELSKAVSGVFGVAKRLGVDIGFALFGMGDNVEKVTDRIKSTINEAREWVIANKEIVQTVAKVAAIVVAVGTALTVAGSAVTNLTTILTAAKTVFLAPIAFFTTIVSLLTSVAVPLAAFVAGFASLVMLFPVIRELALATAEVLEPVGEWVSKFFSDIWGAIVYGAAIVGEDLRQLFANSMLSRFFDSIKTGARSAFGFLHDATKSVGGSLTAWFDTARNAGTRAFSAIADVFKKSISGIIDALKNGDIPKAMKIAMEGTKLAVAEGNLAVLEEQQKSGKTFTNLWTNVVGGAKLIFYDFFSWLVLKWKEVTGGLAIAIGEFSDWIGFTTNKAQEVRNRVIPDAEKFAEERRRAQNRLLDENIKANKANADALKNEIDAKRELLKARREALNMLIDGTMYEQIGKAITAGFKNGIDEGVKKELEQIRQEDHKREMRNRLGDSTRGAFASSNYASLFNVGTATDWAKENNKELQKVRRVLEKIERKEGLTFN